MCPFCGQKQSRTDSELYQKRTRFYGWEYHFICENCHRDIYVEDYGVTE